VRGLLRALLRTLVLVVTGVSAAQAETATDHVGVRVFTAGFLPPMVAAEQADRVYVLDSADNALRDLRFANPGSEKAARARLSALLQTPRGKAAIDAVQRAGEGVAMAWQHGITKLPAVLVDGNYVVYGVFDVGVALGLVEQALGHAH
jgi:integrating conjugative element protein (TIGR03757 family)